MDDAGRDAALGRFLSSAGGDGWVPDTPRILPNTTAYLVRTFDGEALQFSFPLLVKRDLWSEIPLDPAGSDGATAALIEQVKEQAHNVSELGPLYGRGTQFSPRCSDIIEPYTIVHSDDAIDLTSGKRMRGTSPTMTAFTWLSAAPCRFRSWMNAGGMGDKRSSTSSQHLPVPSVPLSKRPRSLRSGPRGSPPLTRNCCGNCSTGWGLLHLSATARGLPVP